MISIDDLYEVLHGLFKEPIIGFGPIKFKLAEIPSAISKIVKLPYFI